LISIEALFAALFKTPSISNGGTIFKNHTGLPYIFIFYILSNLGNYL